MKKPYYIKDDIHSSDLEELQTEFAELLSHFKDILIPIMPRTSHYQVTVLSQIYQEILLLRKYPQDGQFQFANISPRDHSDEIARSCINTCSQIFYQNKHLLAQPLFDTLMKMAFLQEREYYKVQNIASTFQQENHPKVDQLDQMLHYYHLLYDGPFRAGLAFQRILWRVLQKGDLNEEHINSFLSQDVSKIIKDSEGNRDLESQLDSYTVGVEVHVRNAIAHQKMKPDGDRLILWDEPWTATYDMDDIGVLIRNISATILGMKLGLFIISIKFNKELSELVKPIYALKHIQAVLYSVAKNHGFILDDLESEGKSISLKLVKLGRPTDAPEDFTVKKGNVTVNTKIQIEHSAEKLAKSFSHEALSVLNGYEELILILPELQSGDAKILRVDLNCLRNKKDSSESNSCFVAERVGKS